MRERLTQVLFLFRENAADLFPNTVARYPRESLVNSNYHNHLKKKKRAKAPPHLRNPTVLDSLEPEDMPRQLEMLAMNFQTFLDCLNEFPEFTDEAVNTSILSVQDDLKVSKNFLPINKILTLKIPHSTGHHAWSHTKVDFDHRDLDPTNSYSRSIQVPCSPAVSSWFDFGDGWTPG